MILKRDPSRALQIGFLALLIVSSAQVAWWIADQVDLARSDSARVRMLLEADAEAANAALAAVPAAAPARVLAARLSVLMPHLDVAGGQASLRAAALDALAEAARSRVNRYVWEGGFFLLVLFGGMTVLTRTIRHDAQLRRRQQSFLATVSHELKSPLASMRLSAETLALRAADADSQRLGRRLLEDGDRLLNMVDNLLDTTRVDEQPLRLRRDAVPLAPLAAAASNRLQIQAAEHGVDIRCAIPEELRLEGDSQAVETVLRNLLDNALKACIAGAGRGIDVSAEQVGRMATLVVRDDGVGFPAHDAKRIFDKFYRAPDSRTSGTGLGLYIVARLTALSGGKATAASAGPNRGASITVTWPAAS